MLGRKSKVRSLADQLKDAIEVSTTFHVLSVRKPYQTQDYWEMLVTDLDGPGIIYKIEIDRA